MNQRAGPWWLGSRSSFRYAGFSMIPKTAGSLRARKNDLLKPGASVLFAEPKGHVIAQEFQTELQAAEPAGFNMVEQPAIKTVHRPC